MVAEVFPSSGSNGGAVVLVDGTVRRPARRTSTSVQRLLRHVRDNGFDSVPEPLGFDGEGREQLSFLPGDAPQPPLPPWAATLDTLRSVGKLLRGFRDAAATFEPRADDMWFARPPIPAPYARSGTIGHNDIDFGNIVFADGTAVGLIDFDFAAPSDLLWEVAVAAYYLVPLRDPRDSDPELRAQPPSRRIAVLLAAARVRATQTGAVVDAARAFHRYRYDRAVKAGRLTRPWAERYERDERWLSAAAGTLST